MTKPLALAKAIPVKGWVVIIAMIAGLGPLSSVFAQGSQYNGQVVASFTNCSITQLIGTVADGSGNPKTGVRIRVNSGLDYVVYTTSGTYVRPETDASGWDMFLNTGNVANTYQATVVDGNDVPLSNSVTFTTASTCNPGDANVVKVAFQEGAAPPPPAATASPVPTTEPTDPGLATEPAPPIESGATCRTFNETGYRVCDDSNGEFLRTFNDYDLQVIGYPVSTRFKRDGFITQAFQKAILQWRPTGNTATFVNTFDELHNRGFDDQLLAWRQTPRQLDQTAEEEGLTFNQIVQRRQAWLNERPAMRAAYFSVDDPILELGLPTSKIEDVGNHYAIRLQRAVIQQWKEDVPWASAGQVTIANGGDIAKMFGHLPDFAINENVNPPAANPNPVPLPEPAATGEPPRNLDPRWDSLEVSITPANVASGQPYWRIIEVLWQDPIEGGEGHSIFADALDSAGNKVIGIPMLIRWGSGSATIPTENKPFPEYSMNYPMYSAGCSYHLSVADGTPSDELNCLGLGIPGPTRPWRTDHVQYLVKFQKVVKP